MLLSKNKLIKLIKKKKILIISGKTTFKNTKNFLKFLFLGNNKIYLKKNKLPTWNEIKQFSSLIRTFSPNLIIAVGGGSVIDIAKASNFFSKQNKNLKNSIPLKYFKNNKSFCKLICIPTTAGSGSEATPFSVIYVNKKKFSFENQGLKPNFYYLNQDIIKTSSKNVRMSSAFDALAQACESLFSKGGNLKSDMFAKKSLRILSKYILLFSKKPNNLIIKKIQIAANLSGKAIAISKTTGPHALSYFFSQNFNLNHGHAVALSFMQFFKFNLTHPNILKTSRFIKNKSFLFKVFKTKNLQDFLLRIKKIILKMQIEIDYSKLKININKNMKKIIKSTNLERLKNNPVHITTKDLKKIILTKI